jgi:hypothetical protein
MFDQTVANSMGADAGQCLTDAGQSLVDSAETMAFVSLVPAELPCGVPSEALLVSIAFTGPFAGRVELLAPEAFGALLAANMLGCEPSDPDAAGRAVDALKELMNVTCGDLLRKIGQAGGFEMGLPRVEKLVDAAGWGPYLKSNAGSAFDAEGHLVAIRFHGAEA